ncbi:MAG: aldehyde dehydrogenase family protein, partial [Caldilineaceae bacterium]
MNNTNQNGAGALLNYVDGQWRPSAASETLPIVNPATAQVMTHVPFSPAAEVAQVVESAHAAWKLWKETPVGERIQPLFRLKVLLEQNLDAIARTITNEAGKTYAESVAEMRRGIENVEMACAAPVFLQGVNNEDIAPGIDEHMLRQSLGVVAAITPFNFPGMIPLWFLPYAVAAGNCFVLKPSEKVPMTAQLLYRLLEEAGFPPGVVSLVNGGRQTVDALLDHPQVRAISFVGSTPVARYIYGRATQNGKRAQCQGGAKNPVVVMPDADLEMTTRILADSAFGCAGQRCLAASVAITVGDARHPFVESMADAAAGRTVGYGLDDGVQMGPVINQESRSRITRLIGEGATQGATVLVDGRGRSVSGYTEGSFVFPTLLTDVPPSSEIARAEIFGPVLSMMHAATVEEAVALVNKRA